ncbi:hypothetical protein HYH02_005863 [Chlamydomonas schloesseri]|uniref:protein-tyrosine-phosphatase n=1 Tax=Chlamydomonas schloesseri TaxID=2026947 RepID=A0A835WLU0_9CHLO|nr:hypothetical protein HYH02_005863 [Chlamydomonas schloesseri]|eukprot:KAG2449115.1 hypothetical protein HYH02_005863 [Chlamydomonas schloesseri]
MTVQYLEPAQLATALRHPKSRDRVLVLDVRDEDFIGGHVKGAVNSPSELWGNEPHVDSLIDQHIAGKADMVVVHCMFSQQRGPRCALELARRLEALEQPLLAPLPQVYVLRGGFTGFVRHYKSESDLVEGFDPKYH